MLVFVVSWLKIIDYLHNNIIYNNYLRDKIKCDAIWRDLLVHNNRASWHFPRQLFQKSSTHETAYMETLTYYSALYGVLQETFLDHV